MKPSRHYLNCSMISLPNCLRCWVRRPWDQIRQDQSHLSHRQDFVVDAPRPLQLQPAPTTRFVNLPRLLPLQLLLRRLQRPLLPYPQHRQRRARRQRVRQLQGQGRRTQGPRRDWEQIARAWQG